MADNTKDDKQASRKPFVAQEDRPDVRINLDTPISELRVRELAAILRLGTRKDFWDGKDWLKDDFDGGIKWWDKDKDKEKEKEKEKDKDKEKEKDKEKREKPEIKEIKAEKLENDNVFDPVLPPGPDPRLEQVMRAVAGLTQRVSQLADQIEALKKERS